MVVVVSLAMALVLAAVCSPALGAQPVALGGATASVEPDAAYLGTPVRYVIGVDSTANVEPPSIELDWAEVVYRGANQFSSTREVFRNGRRVRESVSQVQLVYTLTPWRTGTFEVPAQVVQTAGAAFEVDPVTLTVLEPEAAPEGSVELRVPDRGVWLGESVRAELVWTLPRLGRNVIDFRFSGEPPEGVAFEPRSSRVVRGRQDAREVMLWGERAIGRVGSEVDGGARRTTFTVELDLIPERAGEIRLGPVDVLFDVAPEGRGGPAERLRQAGEASILDVRPLPDEGRPASFDGLIGRFAVRARTEATEVNVGDPIELTVTVLGQDGPIQLGMITGNQRRIIELNWQGANSQISVRLQRPGGGRLHETFPIRAEPGDRFLLELREDLTDAELVRL